MSVISGGLGGRARLGAPGDRRSPTPSERSRGRRVAMLLVAILLMSLGDLYMTLTHLTQGGMLESNPVARGIMQYNSPALLSLWKLASVGMAMAILYWARRRGWTEVATWFCFLVLVWLTCRWITYSDQISSIEGGLPFTIGEYAGSEWVAMTPD